MISKAGEIEARKRIDEVIKLQIIAEDRRAISFSNKHMQGFNSDDFLR